MTKTETRTIVNNKGVTLTLPVEQATNIVVKARKDKAERRPNAGWNFVKEETKTK